MKRLNKWSITSTLALSAVLLTACGDDSAEENNTDNNNQAGETQAETIQYEALNGMQEIPADPQRVVLLADVYFGYLQELDIDVIATTDFVFQSPFLEEYTTDIENLGDANAVAVEEILALDPDLIIAYHSSEILEQLESITTTVAVDYASLGYKEQLEEFGTMFGREEQAQAWIDDWNAQIDELKPAVQEAVGEQTISILQPNESDVVLYGNGWGRGGEILYQEFELNMPESVEESVGSNGFNNLSLEAVPEYAGDYILTGPWLPSLDGSFLYDSSIWNGLPAVEDDKIFEMDSIGYYFNDPLSIEQHLDEISTFLIENE
ncbi:iron complex transport system substrate-binding protein [Alkalihalobacillus xiaoxiensis]|uniref:Iron complex transport system substrate-binding protein n=1 Tax=Shouchella xiaoxiensis TaxID=766895 RepID=A0ABS2SV46_9BACI|nr:ABC transporter substrate-binding protein [Shouchella xiaoxiensis]MBM7838680.1 iron complex transport system substrate-binding protein [Shouchella xiaoxiensis]